MPELTLSAHELARRQVLAAAATDMQNAAEMLRDLGERTWPVPAARIEDARNMIEFVRESVAAVDALGWPEAS